MTELDIDKIIKGGESLTTEFKIGLNPNNQKAICKEIAAFATTEGGVLLIGIDDEGLVHGVKEPKDLIKKLEGWIKSYIYPYPVVDAVSVSYQGHMIVVVKVAKGSFPVYSFDGRFYARIASSSIPLTALQIVEIFKGLDQEKILAKLQAEVTTAMAVALRASVQPAPAIFGQGELATKNYEEVRDKIIGDILISPALVALQNSVAIATSTALSALSSMASVDQGELATMSYDTLVNRLSNDQIFDAALSEIRTQTLSATVQAQAANALVRSIELELHDLKAQLALVDKQC